MQNSYCADKTSFSYTSSPLDSQTLQLGSQYKMCLKTHSVLREGLTASLGVVCPLIYVCALQMSRVGAE